VSGAKRVGDVLATGFFFGKNRLPALCWDGGGRSNDGIVKLNKVVKFTYDRFPFSLSKSSFLLNKKAKKPFLSRDGGVEHSP
jgi:hypothetical protein